MCRPVAVALIALTTERAVSRSAAIVAKLPEALIRSQR